MEYTNFLSNQPVGLEFFTTSNTISADTSLTKKPFNLENSQTVKRKSKFDSNFPNKEFTPNPFASDKKSSDNYFKSITSTQDSKHNSNFLCKDVPFFQEFKHKKDTVDSWVTSDSKFLNKLNENFSKPTRYLEQFNDSVFGDNEIN